MSEHPASNWMTKSPVFYGWVMVVVGALAMVATLPGRTHGLGMITERLLSDPQLQLDRTTFGHMNFWATMLGATFCLGCGRLIDRFGTRAMLTAVVLGLAAVVLAMSHLSGWLAFFVAILLTRGLGQSALSVVSLTLVGKWFERRLGLAMGVYSILVALGFMAAFRVGSLVRDLDWRTVWSGMGLVLLVGMAPLAWLLTRSTPEACGLKLDHEFSRKSDSSDEQDGWTLAAALQSPAFWVFAIASSTYGLIASGISLFNESILADRGFDNSVYYEVSMISTGVALLSNFTGGWLATRWSIARLMACAMLVLSLALFALPQVQTYPQAVCYGTAMGLAGGIVTVVFFTVWGQFYGRAYLGRIQGVAQMLTVFASALGPVLLAECRERTGSYTLMFYFLAGVVTILGIAAWSVPLPNRQALPATQEQPAFVT